MIALSLSLPTFPTDAVRRRRRLDRSRPVVLSRAERGREAVAACCALAARAGVAPGMTMAHARALVRGVHAEPIDDARLALALRRLAEWSLRFVPLASVDGADGLLLDATGCERLYGGVGPLVERLHGAVRRLGLSARLAAAPTFGAAWGLARFAPGERTVVEEAGLLDALRSLPVAALRVQPEIVAALAQVGVETIGDALALPRASLAQRYGGLPLMLDRALGRVPETIDPVRPREPVREERAFDGPTDRAEAVEAAARDLVERAALRLRERGLACRWLAVRLDRSDLPPLVLRVRVSRPTRDAAHLWSLLRPSLERAHLGFGVEGMAAEAGALVRARHEQAACWTRPADGRDDAELARLIDAAAARLGVRGVLRLRPRDSYVPERAFEAVPAIDATGAPPVPSEDDPGALDRPSILHARPRPATATLLAPDGPLVLVRWGGLSARVVACLGPERVEAEWWRDGGIRRDYFAATCDDGRRLWLYRDLDSGGWFVHGEWA